MIRWLLLLRLMIRLLCFTKRLLLWFPELLTVSVALLVLLLLWLLLVGLYRSGWLWLLTHRIRILLLLNLQAERLRILPEISTSRRSTSRLSLLGHFILVLRSDLLTWVLRAWCLLLLILLLLVVSELALRGLRILPELHIEGGSGVLAKVRKCWGIWLHTHCSVWFLHLLLLVWTQCIIPTHALLRHRLPKLFLSALLWGNTDWVANRRGCLVCICIFICAWGNLFADLNWWRGSVIASLWRRSKSPCWSMC